MQKQRPSCIRRSLLTVLTAWCLVRLVLTEFEVSSKLLIDCYKATGTTSPASFDAFIQSRAEYSRLVLRRVFWSAKASSIPLTVLAGVTLSRLDALQAQCDSWDGPLVAAVYVPVHVLSAEGANRASMVEGLLAAAEAVVQAVFDRTELLTTGCQLRLLLLYEAVGDEQIATLMPINGMRNAALLAATTPLVAMVDVDLLLSAALVKDLSSPTRVAELLVACGARREALILPAFETAKLMPIDEGRQLAKLAVAGGKRELYQYMQQRQLHSFAQFAFARGHNATNYKRWLASGDTYPVEYEVNYEPWFIIDRLASPLYDMRFRGYGWNKVAQVATVNASGFRLMVHPSAFLVHRPHERAGGAQDFYSAATVGSRGDLNSSGGGGSTSSSRNKAPRLQQQQQAKLFHRKVGTLRHLVVRDLKRGTYQPIVDEPTRRCLAVLPWWQGRRNGSRLVASQL